MNIHVSDVNFEPDGTAIITWLGGDDIRCGGDVSVRRSVRIQPSEQYADGLQRLQQRAVAVLMDAMADWADSEPVSAEQLGPMPASRAGQPYSEPDDDEDDSDDSDDRNWRAIEAARKDESTASGQAVQGSGSSAAEG